MTSDSPSAPLCAGHQAPARWRCAQCHQVLCPGCLYAHRVKLQTLLSCRLCGGFPEPLRLEKVLPSVGRLIGSTLIYPLARGGWKIWLGGTFILTILKEAWWVGMLAAFMLLSSYLSEVVNTVGSGDDDLPFRGRVASGRGPFSATVRLGEVALWLLLPALLVTWLRHPDDAAYTLQELGEAAVNPVTLALLLPSLCWVPLALLVLSTETPPAAAWNPLRALRAMWRMGWRYLLVTVLFWGLLGAAALADLLIDFGWAPSGPNFVAELSKVYLLLMAARLLGLLLFKYGDVLEFSWPGQTALGPPVELGADFAPAPMPKAITSIELPPDGPMPRAQTIAAFQPGPDAHFLELTTTPAPISTDETFTTSEAKTLFDLDPLKKTGDDS